MRRYNKVIRDAKLRGRYAAEWSATHFPLTMRTRAWQWASEPFRAPIEAIKIVCNPETIQMRDYDPQERQQARELKHLAYQARNMWQAPWGSIEGRVVVAALILIPLYAIVQLVAQP